MAEDGGGCGYGYGYGYGSDAARQRKRITRWNLEILAFVSVNKPLFQATYLVLWLSKSFNSSPFMTIELQEGTGGFSSPTPSSLILSDGALYSIQYIVASFAFVAPCLKYIWKHQSHRALAMNTSQSNLASPRGIVNMEDKPDHLLVLVHGILASPSDWTYFEAELKRRLGKKFLIYASSCNTYTKTFTGIDGAGKRLADEVMQVVKRTESLKKISFLAHSLGGLFARYAVAVLYTPNVSSNQSDDLAGSPATKFKTLYSSNKAVLIKYATLLNFLKKLFMHSGLKVVVKNLRSALGAFRCRVLYANVSYDHMVGWRTSSVRREKELPKPPRRSLDGYKHVVDVEYCPPVLSESAHFPPEAAKAKEAAQKEPSVQNTVEYHEIMEEEMTHGLQRLGWMKVDVSFHSAFWPFFAHNNIHVKNEWFHNAGAGVVAHVADTIKQQEKQQDSSSTYIAASL
ncbi:UNVERIFIED_CONTAM: hypothetical protein Slati_4056300 [Sesamum latifolium]|uniref:DUF676 domain-containing protein n=1 Tax=Sesamum latifolium TaxID=2727402 RepID=A0AAW2TS13_9LAMI